MFDLKLIEKSDNKFKLTISDADKEKIKKIFGFKVPIMHVLSQTMELNLALLSIGMSWMAVVHDKSNSLDIIISENEMAIMQDLLNSEEINEYCKIIQYSDYKFIRTLQKSFNKF